MCLLLAVIGESLYMPPSNFKASALCNPPVIAPVNFHEYVEVLVGSNRTFSCEIHSDTVLKEGYPKWTIQHGWQLPNHMISNTECPTLSNTTCSNLTLINVSQSDGSGYYTITAENECGSDNFTVNVEVLSELAFNKFIKFLYTLYQSDNIPFPKTELT